MKEPERRELSPSQLPPVKIRRGIILQMTIYEVAEDELESLAHGTPDSIYFNFAVFLLSVATSLLVALLTSIVSNKVFMVFVIIITLGYMLGAFFSVLWFKNRQSTSDLIQKIKNRLPPEGIQEFLEVLDDSKNSK